MCFDLQLGLPKEKKLLHLLQLIQLLQLLNEGMREKGQELQFRYLLYLVKLTAEYRDIMEELHQEESEAGQGEGLADLHLRGESEGDHHTDCGLALRQGRLSETRDRLLSKANVGTIPTLLSSRA